MNLNLFIFGFEYCIVFECFEDCYLFIEYCFFIQVCFILIFVYGINLVSVQMVGMKIQLINVDKNGVIDMRYLRVMVSYVYVNFFFFEFECDLIVVFFFVFFYYENYEIEYERYVYYNFEILNFLLKIMF